MQFRNLSGISIAMCDSLPVDNALFSCFHSFSSEEIWKIELDLQAIDSLKILPPTNKQPPCNPSGMS